MLSFHYSPIRQTHIINNGLKRITLLYRFIRCDPYSTLLSNGHSSKFTSLIYRFA